MLVRGQLQLKFAFVEVAEVEGFQKASATCSSFRAAMAERKFGEISNEEFARLIAEGTNQNTCKDTATWLRTVTVLRNKKKLSISFAMCSAEVVGVFFFFCSVLFRAEVCYK